MNPTALAPRRNRGLAQAVVDSIADRVRDGRLAAGHKLPPEAALMAAHGVSRTVVREALSRLQASGQVMTRHGIGTFVVGPSDAAPFRVSRQHMSTINDVVAMLELRLGLETEAAALAAQRRTEAHLKAMRRALDELAAAVAAGRDAAAADFRFHLEIARATGNERYVELMSALGETMIPRVRLEGAAVPKAASASAAAPAEYLQRVVLEHENILDAIAGSDPEAARAAMRTHLARSRDRRRSLQPATTRRRG